MSVQSLVRMEELVLAVAKNTINEGSRKGSGV